MKEEEKERRIKKIYWKCKMCWRMDYCCEKLNRGKVQIILKIYNLYETLFVVLYLF